MHFIELPKFRMKDPNMSSKLEQWLRLICNEEEMIEIAKNLLKQNVAIGIISNATGLSPEEIEALK